MTRRLVVFAPGIGEVGGAARQSRHLLDGLAASGWKIFAIGRAGSFRWFRLSRVGGFTVLEVPGFRRRRFGGVLYLLCALPLGLILGMRSSGFIAIQLYSQAVAGGICSLVTRKPFVGWTTTSGPLSETTFILESRLSGLRRYLLRRARFVVAQTPLAGEELRALIPAERIVVIPNPVPARGLPALTGSPRVLYAGRFARGKNILGLLDVWPDVLASVPDARLSLVGLSGEPGSVEPEVRGRVETDAKLKASVDLVGWTNDLASFLSTHDIYIFPSRTEGMSNSLLDACAWGRVVVASDIPPNRAVLGDDYPLLFDTHSHQEMASQLKVALSDEGIRRAARAAIEMRLDEFSVDRVVTRWEELLQGRTAPRPSW